MPAEPGNTGRPASFSRDDAIARAMHLFWRAGYLAVTARDLANAMHIQRSSFYNSFGGKEAVFREALQQYTLETPDARLDQIREDEEVIPAIVNTLKELCRARAADKEARGCLICNSVAELVGVEDNLGPELDRSVKHRITVMENLFRRAAEQNEFTPRAAIADIARSFVTFLLGINIASKSIRSEKALRGACRVFLLGTGVAEQQLESLE